MPNYIRTYVPGGTWFFTVNLLQRHNNDLLVREIDTLRNVVTRVRQRWPFEMDAWVVLPEHLHCVLTLPPGDSDFSLRWRLIKSGFARALPNNERRSTVRKASGERGIWQRRFWEHHIRDAADFDAHVRYCWGNPVKHGLVVRAVDWPHSSIHRDIRLGRVEPEWAGDSEDGEFGE